MWTTTTLLNPLTLWPVLLSPEYNFFLQILRTKAIEQDLGLESDSDDPVDSDRHTAAAAGDNGDVR
jgi:hypothetical protein